MSTAKSISLSKPSHKQHSRELQLAPEQWRNLLEAEIRAAFHSSDASRMVALGIRGLSVRVKLSGFQPIEFELDPMGDIAQVQQ
jgi:hypothetical protein